VIFLRFVMLLTKGVVSGLIWKIVLLRSSLIPTAEYRVKVLAIIVIIISYKKDSKRLAASLTFPEFLSR
jgi:hypothetical protein